MEAFAAYEFPQSGFPRLGNTPARCSAMVVAWQASQRAKNGFVFWDTLMYRPHPRITEYPG